MKNNIKPTGLKGNDQVNRMRSLMSLAPINENKHNSVVELTKLGPDGKVYGIVRENHNYFIKIADNKKNLTVEDFKYIGGLQNKTDKVFESYSKATKQLNLKFISLNESLGKTDKIDILKNDNLLAESFESYNEAPKPSQPDTLMGTVKSIGKNDGHDKEVIGDSGETGNPDVSTPPVVEENEELDENEEVVEESEIELTETEKAIDKLIIEMMREEVKLMIESKKLKITTAINKINEGEASLKKKV